MKKKLLIVDDDSFLRNSISAYLIHEGFIVNVAENVHQALILIQEDKPDLIVADIMMQHLDGYDLIKILRTDNLFHKIPVIFLTAKGLTNDRIIGYDLGCNAYVTKPFNPKELVSIINNLFNNIDLLNLSNITNKIELPGHFTNCLLESLTYREKTVLELVVKGFMNKEIAVRLNLSLRNVEKYVSRLLNKTNTRNRTELAQLIVTSCIQLDFDKGE
uniref:TctD transcriptional regulator n=1 Tax=Schimmelmannia schousboei TaxID=173468 RepID=A0A1C9C8X8_9FLOR|nr:hypothetical protein Schim_150 [Schimmelmannia schousboei]AOM64831.1 hypothetical protein Schim_150 [Schimmelmannia schousboei]